MSTLLGLNAVVNLIDGLPVFNSPIELDSDLQIRQCDIDEVRVAGYVDLFLTQLSSSLTLTLGSNTDADHPHSA